MKKQMFNIGKTFEIIGAPDTKALNSAEVEGFEAWSDHAPQKAFVPEVKPHVFEYRLFKTLCAAFLAGDFNLCLAGETGTGKTSSIEQFAARLNIPVVVDTYNRRKMLADSVTITDLVDATTVREDGPLTVAAKLGCIYVADEGNMALPHELALLHQVLSDRKLSIPHEGKTIDCHTNFRFAMTINGGIQGDETGRYPGVSPLNHAFAGRFIFDEVGYMKPEQEIEALKAAVPVIKEDDDLLDIGKKIVEVANGLRASLKGNTFSLPVCFRNVRDTMSLALIYGGDIHAAYEKTLFSKLSHIGEERNVAIETVTAIFGEKA